MDSRDALLADFDHEIAVTRRLIERIPGDSLAWKPHHRSFSLGELATHLAKLPRWGAQILEHPSHDLLSGTGVTVSLASVGEILHAMRPQVLFGDTTEEPAHELAGDGSARRGRTPHGVLHDLLDERESRGGDLA